MTICIFFGIILRVSILTSKDYTSVTAKQNHIRLTASKIRGTIYDRNRKAITNNKQQIIAAVSPTPTAVTAISEVLKGEELEIALSKLRQGKPTLCILPERIDAKGIVCAQISVTQNDLAQHIIGYTDSQSKGISGLEYAYDSILYSDISAEFVYESDGKGDILEGYSPKFTYNTTALENGVVTTLDTEIQKIAEEAAKSIEKGAVIIADTKTAKIRAILSKPNFNTEKPEESLNSKDSPYFNRALNAYNVGSVYKLCVAAAGIENQKASYTYNCEGSLEIIDRIFKCHKLDGHGMSNLNSAIANSCNTYFYTFSSVIGSENIYNMAKNLKFGQKLKLCEKIYTKAGNLPSRSSLTNTAHLANFSIGQGDLLLSPVSMLTLYSAIANGGIFYTPSLTEGILQRGILKEYNIGLPTRAFKSETANLLKECLKSVLEEGTGEEAKPQTVSAAGKTATAQTGKYKNGREICQGWFCGFFPYEEPKYTVIVFSEDTSRQTESCSKIFASIADKITDLEKL